VSNPRKAVCFLAALLIASAPLALAEGTYTAIDVPGAVWTFCTDINATGDVVGYYSDGSRYHGFLRSGGIITTIDIVGSLNSYAFGINDVGQIVGSTDTNGFLYDIPTQAVTSLEYPRNGSRTIPYSINNGGTIAGEISDDGLNVGFLYDGTTYTTIKAPGSSSTALLAINNLEEALVRTTNRLNVTSYYLLNQGNRTKLADSDDLVPFGMNDASTIVGYRKVKLTAVAGFVRESNLRKSLRFPHSSSTVALEINNSGVVVGWFVNGEESQAVYEGFVWTPPADETNE
jgi:uncharacterized membrane protein